MLTWSGHAQCTAQYTLTWLVSNPVPRIISMLWPVVQPPPPQNDRLGHWVHSSHKLYEKSCNKKFGIFCQVTSSTKGISCCAGLCVSCCAATPYRVLQCWLPTGVTFHGFTDCKVPEVPHSLLSSIGMPSFQVLMVVGFISIIWVSSGSCQGS